ncbi:sigma70-ECF: RNA polymerase sigma factor, sigma-70 family [Gaiella occulta]|uniref:Sigma70-ECF: RNA polymerase sigma factor, sigma-70 family n=1 Tax=Gaiella occulta TaxID=1002870 RepID=A0A7M2YTQ4_9ACTN|nr:sigma-70 family RNA polymerase sigma factor [Gaiella occulta]RDI73274.1 sigma70-ECF: RNA polymerase sigma factor, sigma-70 family [Gaiella occulta]
MTAVSLWHEHRGLALAAARSYRLPGADRDDVQQEALIGLWFACRSYRAEQGPFPPFARLVVERHLADCLRGATRGKHTVLTDSVRVIRRDDRDVDAAATIASAHQVADVAEQRDRLRRLMRAIDSDLSALERRCVVSATCGLSYEEMALPWKVVDNSLFRARRKLRRAA